MDRYYDGQSIARLHGAGVGMAGEDVTGGAGYSVASTCSCAEAPVGISLVVAVRS